MSVIYWTLLGFWLGAIPFSLWLGQLVLRSDIRHVGDGNPGAANAWAAGGWRVGALALLLDSLKGALPVGLARFVAEISGWGLVGVALAPALGHAYSPFLRFRGGKALATTFGLWTGLTLAEGPIVLGLLLAVFYVLQDNDSWATVSGVVLFVGYLLLRQADIYLLAIGVANALLLIWKYRTGLGTGIHLRPWLGRVAK